MIEVTPLTSADREAWEELWSGYLRFYRARLPDAIRELTWRRLLDPDAGLHGLAARAEGRPVGLAHYLFHPSTWTQGDYCYLQDLFVRGNMRGHGAGRALIEAVFACADQAGAARVYWLTQDYNSEARALYDTIGCRTSFIQYVR